MSASHKELEVSFWEPDPLVAIPERSRLYSLRPVGTGTGQVECLTSYMSRLADAHNLSVGSLFGFVKTRDETAQFPQSLASYSDGAKRTGLLLSTPYYLNGISLSAKAWAAALERATLVPDLSQLTMIPLSELFDERGLLRKYRAWCPQCYETDRKKGTLYDRLLWCVRVVSCCPIHRTPLLERCPKCNRSNRHFASYILPGYCAYCQEWLGTFGKAQGINSDEGKFAFFAASVISELLSGHRDEMDQQDDKRYSRKAFAANLRACINHLVGGEVSVFAASMQMKDNTLRSWLTGQKFLSPEKFLRLVFDLGETSYKVLLAPSISPGGLREISLALDGRLQVPRGKQTRNDVREVLLRELKSNQFRSLKTIAESLGYASTASLYSADASLCREIGRRYYEHYRASKNYIPQNRPKRHNEEISLALNAALLEKYPPPPGRIASGLGYLSSRPLLERAPELYRKLIKKRAAFRRSQDSRRRKILQAAIAMNPPPSVGELYKQFGSGFEAKFLKRNEPELLEQLKNAAVQHRKKYKERMKEALETALSEEPPPALRVVSRRLGYNVETIRRYFPELVARVVTRCSEFKSEARRKRQEALDAEVLSLAKSLSEGGIAPRYDCIIPLLGENTLKDWGAIGRAIQKARQTLGLEPSPSGPAPKKR